LNTSSFEFYHPDDIENTANEIRKLAGGGQTVNFLQRFKTSTGEYKTYNGHRRRKNLPGISSALGATCPK